MRKQTNTHNAYCSLKEYFHLCSVQALPWVPEGFFFRSEATIVSGKAAIVILAREKKKNPLDAAVTSLTSMPICFELGR